MRFGWITILMLTGLGGCGMLGDSGKYSVYFQPYSAVLDGQAGDTIHSAAGYANAHPVMPVVVTGYSAPPDPKLDVEGLSDQRAESVKQALIAGGVRPNRISTVGRGVTDPANMPSIAVRRVDINVGP